MSLEVINAQGAQVKALEQQIEIRNLVIALLSNGKPANLRFSRRKAQEIAEGMSVNWRQNKDGTIVINISKNKDKK